ncbi:DUF2235 domain-containing protein [Variovorax sp. ZS18.2.2]|uniref:T6SS phospholipase effector Tle1-like catalytic domain-containing protein n=1 Tax=Variovorax sp. ZS18.2.2 TaxID=2971255 RepID=UPI00215176BE|nr:DUF2235 domain-containing protein [Variovorax sp. ZS18.2.2]MCR6480030.1 DUF2235 domain-containing protein [Variovorax sp. ZS18.2.2]
MSEFKTVLQPAQVSCPRALPSTAAHECEFTLNIGVFFDGTDNNRNTQGLGIHTNVVRLSEAYRDSTSEGYFRHYVSGVGTPFSEINEAEAPVTGGPFGGGGEARIIYGLLQVINSVHRFLNGENRFDVPQLAALCSETRVPPEISRFEAQHRLNAEQKILDELGLPQGLVSAGDRSFLGTVLEGERSRFIRKHATQLQQQVQASSTRPKIKAIYLDVFGFSRGAAQARVFVTWLHELLLIGGQLFGADSYVRMLGLFDTVASVGVTDGAGGFGHSDWASARNLRIHPAVKNCVHYVALHELRTNFPSDSVGLYGSIPSNCQEYHCPGAHSDVGGGYGPGEQGKGVRLVRKNPRYAEDGMDLVRDDQLKVANLPLNQMYDAALKTCEGHESIPWIDPESEEGKRGKLRERFGLDRLETVRQAVQEYFERSGVPAGLETYDALRQHGLRYLAWRYEINDKNKFEALPSVIRARSLDPEGYGFYMSGQKIFKEQVRLLSSRSFGDPNKNGFSLRAAEIFDQMKALKVASAVGLFFDEWVHDSYAGFIGKFVSGTSSWARTTGEIAHIAAETQRYIRWRGSYAGSDERLNASVPAANTGMQQKAA